MVLFRSHCAHGRTSSPSREYTSDLRSDLFFRPRQVKIEGLGLVNELQVYTTTSQKVMQMIQPPPTVTFSPVDSVHDSETMTASVLCHHRSSIFFEVRSSDHGQVTIYELDILHDKQHHVVRELQDVEAAIALACVDSHLLRLSYSDFMFIDLKEKTYSVLMSYQGPSDSNFISSISVRYAADQLNQAEVYAVFPRNRSIGRMKLTRENHEPPQLGGVTVLNGGSGSDGVLAKASVREPHSVLATHSEVFFADGCSVRIIRNGVVRTLLGDPGVSECVPSQEESLELAPWASKIARPSKIAGAADGTAHPVALLLTEGEHAPGYDGGSPNSIFRLVLTDSPCAHFTDEKQCLANRCAWAEGRLSSQRLCFDCQNLHDWAAAEAKKSGNFFDGCSLQFKRRAGTRYSLTGCGCRSRPDSGDGGGGGGFWQAFWLLLALIAGSVVIVLCCLRQSGRAAAAQIGSISIPPLRQPFVGTHRPTHSYSPPGPPSEGDIMAEFEEFVDSQPSLSQSGAMFNRGS